MQRPEASKKRAREAHVYIANHQKQAATATAAVRRRPATVTANMRTASGSESSETMLYGFLQEMIGQLDPKRRTRLADNMQRELIKSSACTGTGVAEVVHILMHKIYGVNAYGSFSYEKTPIQTEVLQGHRGGANAT